jgi:hypothetical protein
MDAFIYRTRQRRIYAPEIDDVFVYVDDLTRQDSNKTFTFLHTKHSLAGYKITHIPSTGVPEKHFVRQQASCHIHGCRS